jgi:hypothetical protein
MGQSKRLYEETHLIEVKDDYYKEHYDIFEPPKTRHVKMIIKDNELFKEDEVHKKLVKEYLTHKKKLRDYEYNKRHKQK